MTHTVLFSYVFIPILHMFRGPLCSSSGESIVLIRDLVYVTLCKVTVWCAGLDGSFIETWSLDGHLT